MSQDREKIEKNKVANQVKHIPKDAQVIMSILKEMGITDYEPRVINQLLEFTYRYVTCILDDAKVYANHAKKKVIDLEDIKLATHMVLDKSFTRPPPREVIFDLARNKNNMPLPPIKSNCGLRLPADRYCLSSCNFKLKAATHSKKMIKPASDSRSSIKTNVKIQSQSPSVKRASNTNMGINNPLSSLPGAKPQVTVPKPIFKFSNTPKPPAPTKPKITISSNAPSAEIEKMEVDDNMKRKREDDDFEIVN